MIKGAKLLHFGEETIQAGSGTMILLKKGIYVMAEYIEAGLHFEALLIFLSPGTIKEALIVSGFIATAAAPEKAPYVIMDTNRHLDDYISSFRNYFHAPQLHHPALLQLKQKEFMQLLICTIPSNRFRSFVQLLADNAPEDIGYIMNEYLLHPLSIADYANLSNRSLASFKRDFAKAFHTTPRQWINRKRLEQAHLLLNNTRDRVNEIAYSCGFESPSYFIKLFKEQYGCTPQDLRAKIAIN